jgi:hypothetical protein
MAALDQPKAETYQSPTAGELVPNQGIFACLWKPLDRIGQSIGKIFELYVAPEDLPDDHGGQQGLFYFRGAINAVRSLKSWYGHDGIDVWNDDIRGSPGLTQALKDGTAVGRWFVPPVGPMMGISGDGTPIGADNVIVTNFKTRIDNLYRNRNAGVFNKSFMPRDSKDRRGDSYNYWTITHPDYHTFPDIVWVVSLAPGPASERPYKKEIKDRIRLPCRPCRVREVSRLQRW